MQDSSFWITLIFAALFGLAGLRWFLRQAGGGGPAFMRSGDLVLIAGFGLLCWIGYLAAHAILPVLIALAFAAAVEWHIRQSRRRWLAANAQPSSRPAPPQPEIARVWRIREPGRVLAEHRPRQQAQPCLTGGRWPALAPPMSKHHPADQRISGSA